MESQNTILQHFDSNYNILYSPSNYECSPILDTRCLTGTKSNKKLKKKFKSSTFLRFEEKINKYFGLRIEEKRKYLSFLRKVKLMSESEYYKIVNCGSEELHLGCDNMHIYPVFNRCSSRYCLFCSKKANNKRRDMFKEFLLDHSNDLPLRFMTLTYKNVDNLKESTIKGFKENFKAFKVQLKREGYNIVSGLKVVECTFHEKGEKRYKYTKNAVKLCVGEYKKNEYHYHLHLLYYANYKLPAKEEYHKYQKYYTEDGYINESHLKEMWHNITKNSYICNIQRIKKGVRGGVNYLTAYLTAPLDYLSIPFNSFIEFDSFLKKNRMIDKFGFNRSAKISDYKKICLCPLCLGKLKPFYEYDALYYIQHSKILMVSKKNIKPKLI